MIGFVVYGRRPYGRVERFDGTCVLTTFRHVWFLPILPMGSYVQAIDESQPRKTPSDTHAARVIPIGYHRASILAGYLRTWSVVLLVCTLLALVSGARQFVVSGVPIVVDASFLVGALLCGWLLIGRISPTSAAQRRVYAKFLGLPADVARLSPAQATDLRDVLVAALATEGRALAAGYRGGPDPCESWRELALSPIVQDTAYLEVALTRARLEWQLGPRRERRACAEAHARIWEKLAQPSSA